MDEDGGTTAYDSQSTNNGTLYNGPTWHSGSDCASGSCLSFDGSDDKITIPNSTSLQVTGDLTISFWIRPTNISKGRQNIIDKAYGGEFAFTQETSGSISYYWGTSGGRATPYQGFGSGAGSVIQNQWQHFTLVRDLSNTHK